MGDDLKLFGSPYILVNGNKYELPLKIPDLNILDDIPNISHFEVLPDRTVKVFLRPEVHKVSLQITLYKRTSYRKAKTLARRKNSTRRKRNARRKVSGK